MKKKLLEKRQFFLFVCRNEKIIDDRRQPYDAGLLSLI